MSGPPDPVASMAMRISLVVKPRAYLDRHGSIPPINSFEQGFGLLSQSVLFADTPLPKRNTQLGGCIDKDCLWS